jgi:hypothetical protein
MLRKHRKPGHATQFSLPRPCPARSFSNLMSRDQRPLSVGSTLSANSRPISTNSSDALTEPGAAQAQPSWETVFVRHDVPHNVSTCRDVPCNNVHRSPAVTCRVLLRGSWETVVFSRHECRTT